MPFAVIAGRYMVSLLSMRFTLNSPFMPKYRKSVYSGRDITCVGTSIIIMTMTKNSFLPLNSKRAKP